MKTGLFTAFAVSALPLIAARPLEQHARVVKRVNYVTTTVPAAIVYVNQAGVPYATSTIAQTIVKPSDAPEEPEPVAHHTIKLPEHAKPSKHADPGHHGGASHTKNQNGMAYSPYNADGSCKTQDQVNKDFEPLNDYSMIRIYGTDCDQVTTVGNAAKAKGMKLFTGIFDIDQVNRRNPNHH